MSKYPTVTYESQPGENVTATTLKFVPIAAVTLGSTDADDTLTAAQLLSWSLVGKDFILTADRNLVLPTAADLVAAISGAVVGVTLDLCDYWYL